jgi:hypothetical protein
MGPEVKLMLELMPSFRTVPDATLGGQLWILFPENCRRGAHRVSLAIRIFAIDLEKLSLIILEVMSLFIDNI